uniref:NAD-dependent deacetylase sirtuin-2 n=1 Tax=Lygus hesperus TaxID=30085 RepID=A0A0A9YER2_LYGHE
MSDQKRIPFVGFASSCLRKPFSFKLHKKKPSFGNVHTMNSLSSEVPKSGSPEPCNVSSGGEKNVERIMKMIPGLSHLRKGTTDNTAEPLINMPDTTAMAAQSSETSKLIYVCPPKRDRNENLESRECSKKKTRHGEKSGSSKKHQGVPSSHRIHSRRSRKESKTNIKVVGKKKRGATIQRLNLNKICLNVNVSGPWYCALGKLINNEIKKVVTLSGAGISTAAGIPDFRSPDTGLYDKLKKYNLPYAQAVFERKYFDKNPKPFFALLKETLCKEYKPTIAHYFIKLLEEKGLLLRHFTQNVDGLERLAGVSDTRMIEAHGTVYTSRCMKCKTEYDLQWLRDQLIYQGKSIPYCQEPYCQGIVKPNVILFGETLDSQFSTAVNKDLPRCDLLIVMGTSLVVEPFASAVKKVHSSCSRIIINNIPVGEHLGIVYEGSKDFSRKKRKDSWRDIFIQGSCDDGVLHLAKLFKWERELEDLIKRYEPCRIACPSPSRSAEQSSKSNSCAHAKDMRKRTVKNENNNQKVGISSSSDSKRSFEKKIPSRSILMTDKDTSWQEDEPSSPELTSKTWWNLLTSRVRRFTNSRQ